MSQTYSALPRARVLALLRFGTSEFPNPSQGTFDSVNRIVLRHWQSRDIVIGLWALAREPPKQIPLATFGISSDHAKIVAGTEGRKWDLLRGLPGERPKADHDIAA